MSRIEESIFVPDRLRARVRQTIYRVLGPHLDKRQEPHCEYSYAIQPCDDSKLVVRQFYTGTLQIQGNSTELYGRLLRELDRLLDSCEKNESESCDNRFALCPFPHVGSDEAGKGDYFGPLVVAALFADRQQAETLRAWGVSDSKSISDSRCRALCRRIRDRFEEVIAVRVVLPSEYNVLYSRFSSSGDNLNDLLAACHLQVIKQLIDRTNAYEQPIAVLVDKFARDSLLLDRLKAAELEGYDLESKLSIRQMVRAEEDPVVAAASVVARGVFLESLQDLSDEFDIELPKGAGDQTISAGKNLTESWGAEMLQQVAKLHFANTDRILEDS